VDKLYGHTLTKTKKDRQQKLELLKGLSGARRLDKNTEMHDNIFKEEMLRIIHIGRRKR
jgi:hypothetical protein